jgi:thymidylate synthase (FAD)
MKSSDIGAEYDAPVLAPVPEHVPEIVLAEGPLGVTVPMVVERTKVHMPSRMAYLRKIDVLNGGFVRLVDYMGSDLSIVRSARVSYDADWREEDEKKDEKLIAYLMKNRHTSPFESVTFTFEVKAPIFVFRQWHRHRTWAYNEISARYTELDEGWYVPEPEVITTQSPTNKQMRTKEQHPMSNDIADSIEYYCKYAFGEYKRLIEMGCPRELARSVLPVAAYSRMFATVNLHNLFHFLRLRLHEHSQYEIRVYAEAMLQLIEPIVPVAVKEFKNTL